MLEIPGKYNTAKVFTDNIETTAISQIMNLCNQEIAKDSKIRIMPDVHAGAGCTIGTTMTIQDKIIPSLAGCDLGCGMRAIKLKETSIDPSLLDSVIAQYIPSGYEIHERPVDKFARMKEFIAPVNKDFLNRFLGTLGGGNHFIEVDRDKNGALWLVIHTGSRRAGIEIHGHHQRLAIRKLHQKFNQPKIKATVERLTAEGNKNEIDHAVKVIQGQPIPIPDDLCYLEGDDVTDYLHDVALAQQFALLNRTIIADKIVHHMNLHVDDQFDTMHNYVDTENKILRKGSISAQAGERVIIPMNMRDGSLICIGKGNPEWNFSAPHGAGRLLSRGDAKDCIDLEEYQESMKGIYSTSIMQSTIDESPMVYKPIEEIMENIKDTVDIIDVIKPIYNFKAH